MRTDCTCSAGRAARGSLFGALCIAVALGAFAPQARAEKSSDAQAPVEWKGTIRGQVFDSQKGTPVAYANVTLIWPAPADGSPTRREVEVADPNGAFEFASIPAGIYTLAFSKTGYQSSTLMNFDVTPEKLDRADFEMPPLPGKSDTAIEEIPDVEEFVVLGRRGGDPRGVAHGRPTS